MRPLLPLPLRGLCLALVAFCLVGALTGCVVNPVPTPGSSDETGLNGQFADSSASDVFSGGSAKDAGASLDDDGSAAPAPEDVTGSDAPASAIDSSSAD